MAVGFSNTNKPLNPRGQDASPKGYNRAKLFSGKALDFDGVNDQINLGTISDLTFGTGDFSVVMDWYLTSASQDNWAIAKNPALDFSVGVNATTGTLRLWIGGTLSSSNQTAIGSDWKKIAVIRTSGVLSAYINGVAVSLTETAAAGSIDSGSLFIGSWVDSSFFWGGQMSNIRVFNTALTAAQVADLYNNPEKVVPTGVANTALKLWLPMQEGAGTTAYDGSGNGNHGTISGATYVHGIGAPVSQTAVIDWNKSSNYIHKSEEFETASWSENAILTITNDSFIAPDGSATATEIVENTLNTNHFLSQTLSVTAGDYFISAYVKKRDYDWVQLSTGGDTSRYANFNISTGATGNASGISDLVIQDKGNGWYRIGGKLSTSSTSFNYFITLIQSDVASRFQTYTGTDKGQYIWGAQATKSATLQPYLRNIGTSAITDDVLLPQGLTTGRDITGVNLFENVRKQGALNLDGNSWAEVHDNASLDITSAITLEAWVRPDYDGANYQHLIVKSHGSWATPYARYALRIRNTDIEWWFDDYANSGSYVTSVTGWNHFVVTKDGTAEILYLNGVQVDTNTGAATITANDVNLYLGGKVSPSERVIGELAQPRIYNRALTAAEVLQNYNSGKNTYTNN
jgi:hypothetical protein